MAQKEIEVILTRQLATYLFMPIFVVDPAGTLIFYNEPAEAILGQRFEETGPLLAEEWVPLLQPRDEDNTPLAPEALPLFSALTRLQPAHNRFWIHGAHDIRCPIDMTAFPLIGQAGHNLGAMAIFWEANDENHVLGNARLACDARP